MNNTNERAELIAAIKHELAEFSHNKVLETLLIDSVDMLEADAQAAASPACPSCHAPGLLYECVHCSANSYPEDFAQQTKSKDAELIATHAKLAEAELRANQLESQFKSQCRITASALDERAQQAKLADRIRSLK